MIVKLLTEHHIEFLSLKGGCRGLSESSLVKMSNCWKSHALAQIVVGQCVLIIIINKWTPKGGLIVYAVENWETYSTFDFPGCPYPSPYVNPPMFPAAFAFKTSCFQLREKGA